MSSVDAIADSRRVLSGLVNGRVPKSVNAGGYQTAVAFKEAIEKARKLLASPRSTLTSLNEAIGKLRAYQD